ncbi:MAG: flagellar M-ring protein FliF [Treponema sp.]|nr:flagellar M-ring protein FliF [Treponema sp.]
MNEWLKKMVDKAKEFWKTSKTISKVILIGVVAVVIVAIVLAIAVPSKKVSTKLFNSPYSDENVRAQALTRLDELGVAANVDQDGYITIDNPDQKSKIVSILTSEGLTPATWDPFKEFYNRSWSVTDQEQNVKLKNAMTNKVKAALEVLDDVNSANVTINIPEKELFAKDQNPVSASIILTLNRSSDLLTNTKKQKNLERLVLTLIEGLNHDNLTISDRDGNVLNDFEGLEDATRLSIIEKEQKLRHKEEARLKAEILNHLQGIVTSKRLGDLNVYVEMDMSQKTSDKTIYSPIVRKEDNPNTPYDDSEIVDTLPISEQTVTKEWQGTGFNPEGPAGVEGQTPPVYSDNSNVIGKSVETGTTKNNVINTTHTTEITSPQIGRRSVALNIDGTWEIIKDPKTHQYKIDPETGNLMWQYTPVPEPQLAEFERLVRAAISYDVIRGDTVVVTNNPVDRSDEHNKFQEEYFKKIQTRKTILLSLAAVAIVLVGFILFRIISKEIERRKRLREEELLRQQQAAREQALWDAKDDAGVAVTMSVEESRRAELQENAINMAKEHPEDVAMLIRTWLMEE